jgi:hypothetical protein
MTEVGVHHAHDLRGCHAESGNYGRAKSQLAGPMNDVHVVLTRKIICQHARAVGRIVVHDHELELHAVA